MATLGMSVASDIANGLLTFYVKKGALSQTTQDKPLLRELRATQQTFPGGKDNISSPVQGVYMADLGLTTFLQGYTEDTSLNFNQAQNLLRAAYPWKELHSGLEVTWTEMKKDGLTVTEDNGIREHPGADVVRIVTSLFQNRLEDWGESWARTTNSMLWLDGSQSSLQVPGVLSILTDTPAVGTTGGLDRATYAWWRHRALVGASKITASAENQTLTRTLRSELRQLVRYGGKPNVALCGSKFIDALELEVQAKGQYTLEGFKNTGNTNMGMAKINMLGLGTFEYDPTLDDLGYSKRCYIMDTTKLRLRPMEGEDNKLAVPARPYNYAVFFKSMFWTGGLECTQLNANGVYEVA